MGLNELINELSKNVELLEKSYKSYQDKESDTALELKEKLAKAKAIMAEETAYRDEVNNAYIRFSELKNLYQEVTVIERELKKSGLTPERESQLRNRMEGLHRMAVGRLDTTSKLDDIKSAITATAFKINRLNGMVDEKAVEYDERELESLNAQLETLENGDLSIQELENHIEELAIMEGNINGTIKLYDRIPQLKEELAKIAEEFGEQSEKYVEFKQYIEVEEEKLKDSFIEINAFEMEHGYTSIIDASDISAIQIEEVERNRRKLADKRKELEKGKNARVNQIRECKNKRKIILDKYGVKSPEETLTQAAERARGEYSKFIGYRRNGYAMKELEKKIDPSKEEKPEEKDDKNLSSQTIVGGRTVSDVKVDEKENGAKKSDKSKASKEVDKSNLPVKKENIFSRLFGAKQEVTVDEEKESVEMPSNVESFLLENEDNFFVRDGKMSFFEKEDNKLIRKERDISYYTKKPDKALQKSLDELKKKMLDIYGKDGLKKICDEIKKENGGNDTEFTSMMSSNPLKSYKAIRNFQKKEELDGKISPKSWSNPTLTENKIKVAMALDSALSAREVYDILRNPSKAYKHSFEATYVMAQSKIPFAAAKAVEYKESTLEKMYAGKVKPNFGINSTFDKEGKLSVTFESDRVKTKSMEMDER